MRFHYIHAHSPSYTHKITSAHHIVLHYPFCWVTLCLLLLFVSCYPFIALHVVDVFYLNAYAMFRIMIVHKGRMPLHAWRLQWRGWWTSWIEFMCLISFYLQLSFFISLLTFPILLAYFVMPNTRNVFFTITISNRTRSVKF